jgi:predicted chitinase
MTNHLETQVEFTMPSGVTPEGFEAFLDQVMEELENIGRTDVDMAASLTGLTATFMGEVANATVAEHIKFLTDLQTALHAAECGTPGWQEAAHIVATRGVDRDGDLVDA